jgi:hypothetical protein
MADLLVYQLLNFTICSILNTVPSGKLSPRHVLSCSKQHYSVTPESCGIDEAAMPSTMPSDLLIGAFSTRRRLSKCYTKTFL